MRNIRLSKKEVELLVFIEDKVDDPVKLSHALDMEAKEFSSALEKLEKNKLVLVKKKGGRLFSVIPTKTGKLYLKKKKDLEYC